MFCASSGDVDPAFLRLARDLGERIGRSGMTLVYGGGNAGLMGELARATHENGGRVIGVIPHAVHQKAAKPGFPHELVVTGDMRERKKIMEEKADAFLALPGGFGTLEEFFETVTLKQLGYHSKPVVLLDAEGYYGALLGFLDEVVEKRFAKAKHLANFRVARSAEEALELIGSASRRPGPR